jgi:hypothetical protein
MLFARMLREKRPTLKEFYGAWTLEKGEEERIAAELEKERLRFEADWKTRAKRLK